MVESKQEKKEVSGRAAKDTAGQPAELGSAGGTDRASQTSNQGREGKGDL